MIVIMIVLVRVSVGVIVIVIVMFIVKCIRIFIILFVDLIDYMSAHFCSTVWLASSFFKNL